MWKMLIGGLSGIYVYMIVGSLSITAGGYLGYTLTSQYYQAIIMVANKKSIEEKDAIQKEGDKLVQKYIEQVDKLAAHNASLQKQVTLAVGPNQCTVSNGFVRLYNASATGESTSPSGSDGTSSSVDLTTVLSVALENNEKYRKLADQLIKLQEFQSQ